MIARSSSASLTSMRSATSSRITGSVSRPTFLTAMPSARVGPPIGRLSPSLDYRGLRTDVSLIKRLGSRSLWLASSAEDPLALRTMKDFAAEPSGPREQHVSTVVAHGSVLLDRDADVARALVDWLRRTLLS